MSPTTTLPPSPALPQRAVVATGAVLVVAGGLVLGNGAWRLGALFVIGVLLGVSLYHAGFGFTSAYRALFTRRDASGILAQIVMLIAATALFGPILASG